MRERMKNSLSYTPSFSHDKQNIPTTTTTRATTTKSLGKKEMNKNNNSKSHGWKKGTYRTNHRSKIVQFLRNVHWREEKIVRKAIKYHHQTHSEWLGARERESKRKCACACALTINTFFQLDFVILYSFETYNLSSILNQYISLYMFKHFMYRFFLALALSISSHFIDSD